MIFHFIFGFERIYVLPDSRSRRLGKQNFSKWSFIIIVYFQDVVEFAYFSIYY